MNKKELKQMFEEKIIDEQKYKDELFKLETAPKIAKKKKKLPSWIEEDEFKLLVKAARKKHHQISYLLGFGAGMRISEVLSLKPAQVDFNNRTIIIIEGKGGKDRVVPLPKGFRKEFLQYLTIKCKVRALQFAFTAHAKKAGLMEKHPGLHFHSLRHSFCTLLVNKGVPINQVQLLAGHSNMATTSTYTHAHPKDALKSYEELF